MEVWGVWGGVEGEVIFGNDVFFVFIFFNRGFFLEIICDLGYLDIC